MSRRRKAPADAPSTLRDPGFLKTQREVRKKQDERYRTLCGPITVYEISLDAQPNAFGYGGRVVGKESDQPTEGDSQ
jgi:hypothetical protein